MNLLEATLQALLATIRDEYGSVQVWAIHAPNMDGAPYQGFLDEVIEHLKQMEVEQFGR